jgi:predicted nucleic acid-binding protein
MAILIDSNLIIAAERGQLALSDRIKGRERQDFFLSVVSASELLHGVWRAADSAIRMRRSSFVEDVLAKFPILPIDLAIARIHAEIWAGLASRGVNVGAHDLWIAASALAHGFTIATANVRDFSKVPGLLIECWSDPPAQ